MNALVSTPSRRPTNARKVQLFQYEVVNDLDSFELLMAVKMGVESI